MTTSDWINIGIGILGGGVAGAILNQIFHYRRNKIQPIGKSIELISFFNSAENTNLSSEITIRENSKTYSFSNIYSGSIKVVNKGKKDYDEFDFGITLPDDIGIFKIDERTLDRHHSVKYRNQPTIDKHLNEIDITLKPFNRKDSYIIDFHMTSKSENINIDEIKISSALPVKFTDIVDLSIATNMAADIVFATTSISAFGKNYRTKG